MLLTQLTRSAFSYRITLLALSCYYSLGIVVSYCHAALSNYTLGVSNSVLKALVLRANFALHHIRCNSVHKALVLRANSALHNTRCSSVHKAMRRAMSVS
jgi:hypothetical protein